MSTLYVDNLEPNLGSRVMAAGHVVQVARVTDNTTTTLAPGSGDFTVVSLNFTPTSSSSLIRIGWSHGQSTRVSLGGTNTWLSAGVKIDGVKEASLDVGAIGYPRQGADARYMPSRFNYVSSWTGSKSIAHYVNVGSVGSNWTINHQGFFTALEVMEIAQ